MKSVVRILGYWQMDRIRSKILFEVSFNFFLSWSEYFPGLPFFPLIQPG